MVYLILASSTKIHIVNKTKSPEYSLFLISTPRPWHVLLVLSHHVDIVFTLFLSSFLRRLQYKPAPSSCSLTIIVDMSIVFGLLILCPSNPAFETIIIFLKFRYNHCIPLLKVLSWFLTVYEIKSKVLNRTLKTLHGFTFYFGIFSSLQFIIYTWPLPAPSQFSEWHADKISVDLTHKFSSPGKVLSFFLSLAENRS